jgi:glucosamine--fructose-6-phosphate aminotransferase (isomerizing)
MSQPEVWSQTLAYVQRQRSTVEQAWGRAAPDRVLFTGCGSTHYLALTAASLFQQLTGVPARACPASELVLFPDSVLAHPQKTLLVTVSRSGTTSETVAAANRFRQRGGRAVWCITCDPASELAQASDLVLSAEAAQEQSVAQTRSFSSMLILAEALAAIVAGLELDPLARLPELSQRLLDGAGTFITDMARREDISRFFFLGSGPQYGVACEAMLKMKEMSLSHSEAYHFLEFRHGPMSVVTPESLIVGLLSSRAALQEQQVLVEMAKLGGYPLAIDFREQEAPVEQIGLITDIPMWTLPVLYLPPMQLLAYHRSMSKGLDPDRPQNLTAVVVLDEESFG